MPFHKPFFQFQLEHEALEAEMKRRKHLEDEEAISNSAQDDTEAILKAAKSERSQKFDSSGKTKLKQGL